MAINISNYYPKLKSPYNSLNKSTDNVDNINLPKISTQITKPLISIPNISTVGSTPEIIEKPKKNIIDKIKNNPLVKSAVTTGIKTSLPLPLQPVASYIPKIISETSDINKSMAQAPQRAIVSTAIQPIADVLSLVKDKKIEAKYTPQTKIEKAIFGEEPIKGIFSRVDEAMPKVFNILTNKLNMNKDSAFGASMAIAPLLVGGSVALDLTPFGGEEKTTANVLSKVHDVSLVGNILKKIGATDNIIGEYAERIAKTTDKKQILNFLSEINSKLKATKNIGETQLPKVIDPFIEEINKAKNFDEFKNNTINKFSFKDVNGQIVKTGDAILSNGKTLDNQLLEIWNKNKQITKDVSYPSVEDYIKEQNLKKEEASKSKKGGILTNFKNFYNDLKRKLIDSNAPIEDVLRKYEQKTGDVMPSEKNITNAIDRTLRTPTLAGQFVRDNGLDSIIKRVDNLDEFDQYLIAKQAIDVDSRGIKTGRNIEMDKKVVEELSPKYEQDAKLVNDYSRKLLDYSVDSGLISRDTAEYLKKLYPNYVPINRVFNELEKVSNSFGSSGVASLSKQTVVQKLVGSEREIESPIKSLLEKTVDAFTQGEKNKTASMLASYSKLPGNPFELTKIKEGESLSKNREKRTISFLNNGVKEVWETTPEISNAAKNLNAQQLNIIGKILQFPVRVAKIGITGINLPFVASNIAKDQLTAAINSSHSLKTSIANPAIFVKSLFEAIGHGKVYEEMARNGALGTSFDMVRNQVVPTIEKIRSGKNIGSKILYTVKHPSELLRAVENIISRSEELTRIQQYVGTKKALMDKGLSNERAMIDASLAARKNTVDFARKGEWGQVLNSALLYLNASIQGTRTFVRTMHDKPAKTALKLGLYVFTPIVATTAWNLSDPERKSVYDDIAEYEKENNIIIIPPNPKKNNDGTWDVIKIPLSQEVNNIASLPRRAIEQAVEGKLINAQDISKALVGTISPITPDVGSIMSTVIPQAIKPTVESYTNKNFFTGLPQVPSSLEKLSPELQVKDYTSGTARKIGKILNVSPIKVEEFIKGTLGGVGSQALHLTDMALSGLNIIPKDQIGGQKISDAIIFRFSKARGGHLDDVSNKKIQDIIQNQNDNNFKLKQEAELIYEELKKLTPEEANKKADELYNSNPSLYDKLETVVKEQKKGLDYNDRLILQLQVNNGERAKFIWENLKAFKTPEEKNKYIKDLDDKGIISDEIYNQLGDLKKSEPIKLNKKEEDKKVSLNSLLGIKTASAAGLDENQLEKLMNKVKGMDDKEYNSFIKGYGIKKLMDNVSTMSSNEYNNFFKSLRDRNKSKSNIKQIIDNKQEIKKTKSNIPQLPPREVKVKRDGKEVDVNNIDELVNLYKVRKNYGDKNATIGNIDLTTRKYATNPDHVRSIKDIYNNVKDFNSEDMYKEFKRLGSQLQWIVPEITKALNHYGITPGEFVAVVRQDSRAGTRGLGAKTKNVGNIGNTDSGGMIKFDTWLEGAVATIRNLAERKVEKKQSS